MVEVAYVDYTDWQTDVDLTAGKGKTPPSTTVAAWCLRVSRLIDSFFRKKNITYTHSSISPNTFVKSAAILILRRFYHRWLWARGEKVEEADDSDYITPEIEDLLITSDLY